MRSQNTIIEIIESIMEKYNVGKRPLSLILGLGEITITRYLNGETTPDENIANLLNSVLNNPNEYLGYLEKNKTNINISKLAYNKSKMAVDKLISKDQNKDLKIKDICNYIINKDIGITNLKLQKLLYYCQLFSYVLNNKPLFSSQTEAWQHGPVYEDVYVEYKPYGDKEISLNDYECSLSDEDKLLIDNVVDSFGIYSGNVLCYFTHSEEPWKETYNGLNSKISKDRLQEYANKIKIEEEISSVDDIVKHSERMINIYKKRK